MTGVTSSLLSLGIRQLPLLLVPDMVARPARGLALHDGHVPGMLERHRLHPVRQRLLDVAPRAGPGAALLLAPAAPVPVARQTGVVVGVGQPSNALRGGGAVTCLTPVFVPFHVHQLPCPTVLLVVAALAGVVTQLLGVSVVVERHRVAVQPPVDVHLGQVTHRDRCGGDRLASRPKDQKQPGRYHRCPCLGSHDRSPQPPQDGHGRSITSTRISLMNFTCIPSL